MFAPREAVNPLDDETMITEGLRIEFDYASDAVTFTDDNGKCTLPIIESGFTVAAYNASARICGPADCASCSLQCK